MSNLFKNLKPSTTLHKNGFDLSQRHLYTASAGELLPTLTIDCVPGDKFSISKASLARTMPLNTAAFARINWFHHFYFVPYSILWSNWDSFITQRKNNYSASAKGSLVCPSFNIYETYQAMGNTRNLHGFVNNDLSCKLLDHLGYGHYIPEEMYNEDIVCNIFRLAAYNKIWYDYYRNPYYDDVENVSRMDYVYEWNFDDLECRNSQNAIIDWEHDFRANNAFVGHMFSVKYRQWKKDILTSLLPNTQYGAVSFVNVGSDEFMLSVVNTTTQGNNPFTMLGIPNQTGEQYLEKIRTISSSDSEGIAKLKSSDLGFDVLTLRKAEALQRWKETTLRAGQQALSQYDAHFGVRPRHSIDHVAHFIGGMKQTVMIDEVLTTANNAEQGTTTPYGAGDIYGKGLSYDDNGNINFESSEFGVLMCISSFVPEADYIADGCDKGNLMFEPFDFFTPEFQNIGLEGVPYQEFYSDAALQVRNTIVGYAPRYWSYKTAKDKIHGGFIYDTGNGAELAPWVTPRNDYMNFAQGLTRKSLYISPRCLNNIFGQEYTGKVDTDQFLCNDNFNVKAIRPMSILGLPNF